MPSGHQRPLSRRAHLCQTLDSSVITRVTSIYDFEVETITGERTSMDEYRGQVLLIVNTASK